MTAERPSQVSLRLMAALAMAGLVLTACATPDPRFAIERSGPARSKPAVPPPSGKLLRGTEKPYQIKGVWYYPHADPDYDARGMGSWYGEQFHNRRTANGELFDMDLPSAAHKTLPLPSLVEVTNLDNGRKMTVRVNDRGPFIDNRIIDLSRAAADELGYRRQGVARVRVRYIGPAAKSALPSQQVAERESVPSPVLAERSAEPKSPLPSEPDREARRPNPSEEQDGFRIQAGAFANRDNAVGVAAALQPTADAIIEPMERSGGLLYRVVVAAGSDETDAWTLRERIAALGFPGATVLRP